MLAELRSLKSSALFLLRSAWNFRLHSTYQSTIMMRRSRELREQISSSMPVIFFLHVPKTGGTDLAIKLQESMRFNVFSLDAPEEDYRLQVKWFNPERPTFIRAHMYANHAWNNFLKWQNNLELFTIIRSPYALHVSLATMMLERMESKADGELGMSQQEYVDKLLNIIKSPSYLNDYRDIYFKYFAYLLDNLSLMNRLRVVGIEQVDALQRRLIPGDPVLRNPRLNQSRYGLKLTPNEILNSELMLSLSCLVSSNEISLYRRLQSKIGDVEWALSSEPA